ncbi:MAG: hypothetical protein K1060chlam5_00785 [Candidatus Anoxychlamydiales bacterium]|nr:hypothetical protein [Candidatus Anoxychlamydiales bacterium]
MTFIKRLSLLIATMFLVSSAFAESYDDSCQPCPPKPVCKTCDAPEAPTMSAYNHPARINVCGSWDMFVTGTFLWWQPKMEGLELAVTDYTDTNAATQEFAGNIQDMSFDWKAAFKVGLGYNSEFDDWNLYLNYTRVNTSNSTTAKAGTNKQHSLWLFNDLDISNQSFNQNPITETTGKWELDHNMFDLELGRPYYNGQNLIFKAHYGLKSGWIDQKFTVTGVRDPDAVTSFATIQNRKLTSSSWLIGPRTGFDSKWVFGEGFRLFGNAAVSAFFQKFDSIEDKNFETTSAESPLMWRKHTYNTINTSLDLLLGLGWDTYFDNNNWYFDLSAGYEVQVYFNQNIFTQINSYVWVDHDKPGNLTFHGLTLTARFDF